MVTWSAEVIACPVLSVTSTHTSVEYSKLDQLMVRSAAEENSAPSSSVYPILSLPLRGTLRYTNDPNWSCGSVVVAMVAS
ncbi:Uncharacterised protein [Mycobacteroides abscessus]|nr:Uncharacterised protein [Mycobacteroides abscessus]